MALVPNALLVALDAARTRRGALGLNPFRVYLRIREWPGGRVWEGNQYIDNVGNGGQDLQITVGQPPIGPQPCKVTFVSTKEIIASAGLYRDRDMRVGPFTPPYGLSPSACHACGFGEPHGGFSDSQIDPAQYGDTATDVFWRVEGPTMAKGGSWFNKLELTATSLHYFLTLRANGTQPGP